MKNIERRRKQRKLIPLLIPAAALIIALAVLLTVTVKKHRAAMAANASDTASPVPLETAAAKTPVPEATQTFTDDPTTEKPETEAPETEAPTEEAGNTEAAETPEPTGPVRISDENSLVILSLEVKKRFDSSGRVYGAVSGRCAISFVNNTDRTLYSASFRQDAVSISSVTLDGCAARFTFSEDGILEIPFVNELPMGESCEVYFEYTSRIPEGGAFSPITFGYETAYALNAYIESDVKLSVKGCDAEIEKKGASLLYTVADAVVHGIEISLSY